MFLDFFEALVKDSKSQNAYDLPSAIKFLASMFGVDRIFDRINTKEQHQGIKIEDIEDIDAFWNGLEILLKKYKQSLNDTEHRRLLLFAIFTAKMQSLFNYDENATPIPIIKKLNEKQIVGFPIYCAAVLTTNVKGLKEFKVISYKKNNTTEATYQQWWILRPEPYGFQEYLLQMGAFSS